LSNSSESSTDPSSSATSTATSAVDDFDISDKIPAANDWLIPVVVCAAVLALCCIILVAALVWRRRRRSAAGGSSGSSGGFKSAGTIEWESAKADADDYSPSPTATQQVSPYGSLQVQPVSPDYGVVLPSSSGYAHVSADSPYTEVLSLSERSGNSADPGYGNLPATTPTPYRAMPANPESSHTIKFV
jgi:hypothetical protein